MNRTNVTAKMDIVSQISEGDLSVQLSAPHQRVLKNLVRNSDVSHVLCFQSPLTGTPRLVPVGESLDFIDVESAVKHFGATASHICCVCCGAASDVESGEGVASLSILSASRSELSASQEMLELRNRLKSAEIEIQELGRLKELKAQLEQHEENLNNRELSLIRMEDELMDRMNRYMERVAEIEQREENVAAREAALGRDAAK